MKDEKKFKELLDRQYRAFREPLLRTIRGLCSDALSKRCSPEDILQETAEAMMRCPEFILSYTEMTPLRKWEKMAYHTLTDNIRRHREAKMRSTDREITLSRAFSNPAENLQLQHLRRSVTSPRSAVQRSESARQLMACIRELPPEERRIIALRQLDRYSARECADILGITLRQANTDYVRAMRRLRKKLEQCSGLMP